MGRVCVPWGWSVFHDVRVHVHGEGSMALPWWSRWLGALVAVTAVCDLALPWWTGQGFFVPHRAMVTGGVAGRWPQCLEAAGRSQEGGGGEDCGTAPARAASCTAPGSSDPSWAVPVPQGLNPIPL